MRHGAVTRQLPQARAAHVDGEPRSGDDPAVVVTASEHDDRRPCREDAGLLTLRPRAVQSLRLVGRQLVGEAARRRSHQVGLWHQ